MVQHFVGGAKERAVISKTTCLAQLGSDVIKLGVDLLIVFHAQREMALHHRVICCSGLICNRVSKDCRIDVAARSHDHDRLAQKVQFAG